MKRFHTLVDRELAATITSAESRELNAMRARIDLADQATIQALREQSARDQAEIDAVIAKAAAAVENLRRASVRQKSKSASRP